LDLVQRGVKRLSALGHAALDELLAEGGGISTHKLCNEVGAVRVCNVHTVPRKAYVGLLGELDVAEVEHNGEDFKDGML